MKEIAEVLRSKELDVLRVRREVQALRTVAPLLDDGNTGEKLDERITAKAVRHISVVDMVVRRRTG